MRNFYLKLYKPPTKMRVGKKYTFRFEISKTKPKGEYVELHRESGYYIQVCGIGNNWTEGDLIFPFDCDEEEILIRIEPAPPFNSKYIELDFDVKRGEDIYGNFMIKIKISGTEVEEEAGLNQYKEVKKINLKFPVEKLSNNQGILIVSANGNRLELYGVSGFGKTSPIFFQVTNNKGMKIESYVDSLNPYHDLMGLGKNLYHEMDTSISRWMILLCNQKNPKLLVCDYTDIEAPWELIYMDSEQCKGFLGELLAISRWQRVAKGGQEIIPQIFCNSRRGSLASYIIDEKEFRESALEEIQAVKKCRAITIATQKKLLEFLNEARKDIAVLHLACHGSFDTGNPQKAAIDLISTLRLSAHDMNLIVHSQPVLFVNACHSARKEQLGWAVNGVNVPFIRKGANGFIGVMGRVRSKEAAKIASRLLEEMQRENPLPIAEILRKLRKEAVENARKDDSNENQKAFRDAFMYVFYGSPLSAVSINVTQEQSKK
jgi:hypothetical protein